MAILSHLLLSLAPLACAIVAMAFAIKATMDKDWASRNQYNASLNEVQWGKPAYVEYRSPFTLCGLQQDNLSTSAADTTYSYGCETFLPYGRGKTSCESWNVTGSNLNATYGDQRRCQQVHWAGNLAVASSSFMGLGFILTVLTTLLAVGAILFPAARDEDQKSRHRRSHDGDAEESNTGTTHRSAQAPSGHARKRRPHEKYLLPAAPYINVILMTSFVFGAILFVLAQFYGIIAFVQSAPDNGAFAAYGDTNQSPLDATFVHAPWVQGRAMSVYAPIAWIFAGITAMMAGIVWRTPRLALKSPL